MCQMPPMTAENWSLVTLRRVVGKGQGRQSSNGGKSREMEVGDMKTLGIDEQPGEF